MDIKIDKYLVGGAVRDRLLGLPVTERDWVVVGATPDTMLEAGFRPVGQDFPVFLEPGTGEEYALARTERKSGKGYGGFVFHASPEVTLEEDLRRRDLTVNAMAEAEDGSLIDPYGGQQDLQARLLRHVSPAFAEDPLRVLRVARFAARYAGLGFRIAPETLELMRGLAESGELQALTTERSWKEISRALMEQRPEIFFRVLGECGALAELFPELLELFAEPAPDETFPDRGAFQLAVLQRAALAELPLAGRWAALLQGFADQSSGVTAVDALSSRCRVPRDCSEQAHLCCAHLADYRRARELSAGELTGLFKAMDVYRRPERFELFLKVCEAEQAVWSNSPDASRTSYLKGAARIAREISIQPLLEKGLSGGELGRALEDVRQEQLERYRLEQTGDA